MSGSLLLLPKNVVINHIVVHLLYKERDRLYSTCTRFWYMFPQPREYIFGYWRYPRFSIGYHQKPLFELIHCRGHRAAGCASYQLFKNGNLKPFVRIESAREKSVKRKLDDYVERFGTIGKKQRK